MSESERFLWNVTTEMEMPQFFKCLKCGDQFLPDRDREGELVSDKLCYHCFNDAIEDFEEKKRERIARQNEY